MVERLSLGWVSSARPLLDGVPDIGFNTSMHGETIRWKELRRRYVGQLVWVRSGSPDALQGVVEVGTHAGRLAGAVIAGQWGQHPIHPDLGLAVAFHVHNVAVHRVELHGRKAKNRSLNVQLFNGDQLAFHFDMVIGQSRKWRAKLDEELASQFVGGMCGVEAVRWIQDSGRPDVQIAG